MVLSVPILCVISCLRIRTAFGCYGWSGESVKLLQVKLAEAGFEVIEENVRSMWNPEESDFEGIPALVKSLIG